jgi:enolase
MARLEKLLAREVLDSRGNPTVEVEAIDSGGVRGRAIVPAGASTGRHEALELRDGDGGRYGGKGVRKAVGHVVRTIAPAVAGFDLDDQASLDRALIELDGTPNRSRLGANAILGVSLAVAHAAAAARGEELYVYLHRLWQVHLQPGEPDPGPMLPLPMVNMISGGLHAGRYLDIQDVLIVPVGPQSYPEALALTVSLYRCLGKTLQDYGEESALVGDEGGFGPRLRSNAQAVERVLEAVQGCGHEPGRDVAIAVDVAATQFFDQEKGLYQLAAEHGDRLDASGMSDLLAHWVREFPIVSIEDPLAEDDWDAWTALTARLGAKVQLIGDDLFATQPDRIRQGIERKAANAVLIKLNQVGTLTETLEAMALARRHGYRTIVSARSGETEDATIADLAVATGAGQIKIGSVVRSERLAKYNRLLRIAEMLGPDAPYAGRSALEG